MPGSKEDVVEGISDAERATTKDTEDKVDAEVGEKEEDTKSAAEMDDETKSSTKSEDEDEDEDRDGDGDEDENDPASEDSTNSEGKTYCVCGKESYGKMIACDNKVSPAFQYSQFPECTKQSM